MNENRAASEDDHNADKRLWRTLISACDSGDIETVNNLLAKKDINLRNTTERSDSPLLVATRRGHHNVAILLLQHGADVNEANGGQNMSLLMAAAANGNLEMVRILLEYGADVNMQSFIGVSALMNACRGGHSETAKILLECGADVNMQDDDGRSPLMIAGQNGHSAIVKLLLQYHANINM